MDVKNFADRLSACRQNRRMTQEEFASRIGVTPQAVSKWERGIGLPDTGILADICRILHISADDLLKTGCRQISENGNIVQQEEVLAHLDISDPLQILLGYQIIEAFQKSFSPECFHELRRSLAKKGILMPTVRILDVDWVQPDSFVIRAYQRTLYEERLDMADENTASYIWQKLRETVSDYRNYAYILNRDLVKIIVERAAQLYPSLIAECIPERISYRYLHQILRGLLNRGKGISNMNKIIEVIDDNLDNNPTTEEMLQVLMSEL